MADSLNKLHFQYSFARGGTRGTAVAQERYKTDLKRALDEIDGLFAGFRYIDKIDPSPDGSSPASTVTLSPSDAEDNGHTQPFLRDSVLNHLDIDFSQVSNLNTEDTERIIDQHLNSNGKAAVDHSKDPAPLQWTAIRSLREAMSTHFDRFRDVCTSSNNPVLRKLLDSYSGPKGLREAGIVTFRDLLNGYTPTNLKSIFAFASLSYAISKLLIEKRQIEEDQILDGLVVWKNAISKPEENEAFRLIAIKLWPESKHVLHAFSLPNLTEINIENFHPHISGVSKVRQESPTTATDATYEDAENRAECLADITMLNFEGNLDNSNECYFQPDPPVDMRDVFAGLSQPGSYAYNLTQQMAEGFGFSVLRNLPNIDPDLPYHNFGNGDYLFSPVPQEITGPPPSQVPPGPSPPVSGNDGVAQPNSSEEAPSSDMLRETLVFSVVFDFFDYLSNLGDTLGNLLRHLSKDRVKTETVEQGRIFHTYDNLEFQKKMRKTFFRPLREGKMSNPQCLALLAMAKGFVQLGLLRTLDQVEDYLISVSRKLIPSSELYREFRRAVVNPSGPRRQDSPPRSARRHRSHAQTAPEPASRRFLCSYRCGKSYKNRANQRRHERDSHEDPVVINCPYQGCKVQNKRRDLARQHFHTKHPGTALPPSLLEKRRRL